MTTAQLVQGHLEKDLVMNEALARGFLSVRKAARRLIEERGWDATEEAVVSAIRRYDPAPSADLENVFHLLGQTRRTAETGLAMVRAPRNLESVSSISEISDIVPPEKTFGVIPDDTWITVILDDRSVPAVEELLSLDTGGAEVQRGLGRIELAFPERSPLNNAALAVVLYYLGHHDVGVVNVHCTLGVCSIYVSETTFADAYELTKELQSRNPS